MDIIGSLLSSTDPTGWWKVILSVGGDGTFDLFWNNEARMIARAFGSIYERGSDISISTVVDELNRDPDSDRIFQPDVKTFIVNVSTQSTINGIINLKSQLTDLVKHRANRTMIKGIEKVRGEVLEGDVDPNEFAGKLRDLALDGGVVENIKTMGEIISELEAEDSMGVPWRAPSGIEALDDIIRGGYEPGRLYVIGARPKVGKTLFVINGAVEALASDCAVLIVSLEIQARELWTKILACHSNLEQKTISAVLSREVDEEDAFDPEELEEYHEAAAELKAAPLNVIFPKDVRDGVDSIANAIISLRMKYGESKPIVVFVDYLQLAIKGRGGENLAQEMGRITRTLKLVAGEYQAAIVAPAQINRAGAEDGMPSANHLKDSGSIEQDADVVILLNREYLQDETKPSHIMDIWVELNRTGPPGWVKANYQPETQTLADLDYIKPEPDYPVRKKVSDTGESPFSGQPGGEAVDSPKPRVRASAGRSSGRRETGVDAPRGRDRSNSFEDDEEI